MTAPLNHPRAVILSRVPHSSRAVGAMSGISREARPPFSSSPRIVILSAQSKDLQIRPSTHTRSTLSTTKTSSLEGERQTAPTLLGEHELVGHGFSHANTTLVLENSGALAPEKTTQTAPMLVSSLMNLAHQFRLIRKLSLCAAALCAAALSPAAHALERVNLTNGFSIDCARHEQADSGHIRLIYATGSQLLRAAEIASIDILPDPPQHAAAPAALIPPVVAQSDLTGLIAAAGVQRDIDVDLLASIIHNESGFHVKAVSPAGARGLMQLMPATARNLGVQDSFNPGQNINGGAQYLSGLLKRYFDPRGDAYGLELALAAYNAGPGAVDRYHGIPPYRETRAYVARVLNEFVRRKNALKKSEQSSTIASR